MQFVTHCYKTVVNNRYNDFLQKVIKEKKKCNCKCERDVNPFFGGEFNCSNYQSFSPALKLKSKTELNRGKGVTPHPFKRFFQNGRARPLLVYFDFNPCKEISKWAKAGFFFKHEQNLTANKCENDRSSIRCWDSNPRPLEHGSPPITTRPWLPPPLKNLSLCFHCVMKRDEQKEALAQVVICCVLSSRPCISFRYIQSFQQTLPIFTAN